MLAALPDTDFGVLDGDANSLSILPILYLGSIATASAECPDSSKRAVASIPAPSCQVSSLVRDVQRLRLISYKFKEMTGMMRYSQSVMWRLTIITGPPG